MMNAFKLRLDRQRWPAPTLNITPILRAPSSSLSLVQSFGRFLKLDLHLKLSERRHSAPSVQCCSPNQCGRWAHTRPSPHGIEPAAQRPTPAWGIGCKAAATMNCRPPPMHRRTAARRRAAWHAVAREPMPSCVASPPDDGLLPLKNALIAAPCPAASLSSWQVEIPKASLTKLEYEARSIACKPYHA